MGALDGRTAIVTGAGRGIGAAIAAALDAAGARVALVARSETSSPRSPADARQRSGRRSPADLGTPDGPGTAVAAALDAFGGRLDVLVNNAGIALRKDSETLTVEEIDLALERQRPLARCCHRGRAAGDARRRLGLDHLDQLDQRAARRAAPGRVRGDARRRSTA